MELTNNSIIFLHLSDIHIKNESDISDLHISMIVKSLNVYKNIVIKNIIIVISGDLAYSGEKSQFDNARKMLDLLIQKLNNTFSFCKCDVLIVPGNHDVMHNNNILSIDKLKNNEYSSVEMNEISKLEQFYLFSNYHKCFENKEIYCNKRIICVDDIKIQANLINNAIYSTIDEYKGLLYIPYDKIDELKCSSDSDFVITIMHHAPDFYKDEVKNYIEEKLIRNSSILFYGHEHQNNYKLTSYNGSNTVILQSGGCLCNNGDWNESSYIIGVLNTNTKEYNHQKFTWNKEFKQYEHNEKSTSLINKINPSLLITTDFANELYDEDYKKDYFVFPSILLSTKNHDKDKKIDTLDSFVNEILSYQEVLITGSSNIGKSTLLKKLFEVLSQDYTVLFCSPNMLLSKSNNKKHDIDKLIKELFKDIYGNKESDFQSFEQSDKSKCIFIFDDFDQVDGINLKEFKDRLSQFFCTIILSSSNTIDFNPINSIINEDNRIAKFELKPILGSKRKSLIKNVVTKKADDKSDITINNIVGQINKLIKSLIKIIPPEPYYIIQFAEHYLNNIGEVLNSSSGVFSKVFEANITAKIDMAINRTKKRIKIIISVDKMYLLIGRIAHYIHFNKAYPISRSEIEQIIKKYNDEYGNSLVTDDIILIAKEAKVLIVSNENNELYRFGNKTILAYFVAQELINKKDSKELESIIDKSCINICTDILLFVIFQTDNTDVLISIFSYIEKTIDNDINWKEFDIHNNVPHFLKSTNTIKNSIEKINIHDEKIKLEQEEEEIEKRMVNTFEIKDIYDWEDESIENFNNKLNRSVSLLHIISKSFPCFEHILKINEKKQLVEYLYRLPNMIFMFWARTIDKNYDEIIEEIKLTPYLSSKKYKNICGKKLDEKIRNLISGFSMHILLNLYYLSIVNAFGDNTHKFLTDIEVFDYSKSMTHQLENLMILEQLTSNDEFIKKSIKFNGEFTNYISKDMLKEIVKHAIITRNDKRENIQKLESEFFPNAPKTFIIERSKNKSCGM